MTRLGSYSGDQVVQVFKRAGWRVARLKGSHVIMIKKGIDATLSGKEDYTSNNTRILGVEEIKEVLLKVEYIQEELRNHE